MILKAGTAHSNVAHSNVRGPNTHFYTVFRKVNAKINNHQQHRQVAIQLSPQNASPTPPTTRLPAAVQSDQGWVATFALRIIMLE